MSTRRAAGPGRLTRRREPGPDAAQSLSAGATRARCVPAPSTRRSRAPVAPPPPPRLPRGPAPRRARAAELSDAAVVSRSWGMALATLVSRLTGFARIVLLATILGAALSSAFTVANQLPNLIAALVLEATFTAIFVPVLARAERDDPDGGTAFVRRLVTLATTLLLVVTVLSVAAAPLLVDLMLGSDPLVNRPLTTAFAYLLLPQVIFYGLSSVFMAILNTRNVFGPPAWAPVVNNVVAIVTLGLYVLVPGELSIDPVEMGNAKLLVLGIGTTLGVCRPDRGAVRRDPAGTDQPAAAVGYRRPPQEVRRDGRGDGALRADQPDRFGRRQPDRQCRSGFRARHLQLHVAGAAAAVRHHRRHGADGGDAATDPQRRGRRTAPPCWPTCRWRPG